MVHSFLRVKKELNILFCNIYLYLFIYIYILIYLYIYIEKKNATFCVLLQKIETFSRSFSFYAKECCILCVLCILLHSLEKNPKECIFLLGLISCQKLKKKRKIMLRFLKERKRMMCSERKRTQCPTLLTLVAPSPAWCRN